MTGRPKARETSIIKLYRVTQCWRFWLQNVACIEIVGLEGALGHVILGKHGKLKWYQQGGKNKAREVKQHRTLLRLCGQIW